MKAGGGRKTVVFRAAAVIAGSGLAQEVHATEEAGITSSDAPEDSSEYEEEAEEEEEEAKEEEHEQEDEQQEQEEEHAHAEVISISSDEEPALEVANPLKRRYEETLAASHGDEEEMGDDIEEKEAEQEDRA